MLIELSSDDKPQQYHGHEKNAEHSESVIVAVSRAEPDQSHFFVGFETVFYERFDVVKVCGTERSGETAFRAKGRKVYSGG
ncbi:MAG: hypothetical protein ACD_47C00683G0002 [uncultured bacterium]|nr:MAG: hypothetical protein ACD_47C00683G0002 [uncultured bacterium]